VSRPRRRLSRVTALYVGGAVLALWAAFPFLWMLSTSLKESSEVFASPPTLVPRRLTLGNFARLLTETNFATYFGNSLTVSFAAVVLTLGVSAVGAYGLTRFRFRDGRRSRRSSCSLTCSRRSWSSSPSTSS